MEHFRSEISQICEEEDEYRLYDSHMRSVFGNKGTEHAEQDTNKHTANTDYEEL